MRGGRLEGLTEGHSTMTMGRRCSSERETWWCVYTYVRLRERWREVRKARYDYEKRMKASDGGRERRESDIEPESFGWVVSTCGMVGEGVEWLRGEV